MAENPLFDGIILLYPYFRTLESHIEKPQGLGSILGVAVRELAFGPPELEINIARPTAKPLDATRLVWFNNCPGGDSSPYSVKACCYNLLRPLSDAVVFGKMAVRSKPSRCGQEFAFWERGKLASLGAQYFFNRVVRDVLGNEKDLYSVTNAWLNKDYDMEISGRIGELNQKFGRLFDDVPVIQLEDARHKVEITGRDAAWPANLALIGDSV